MDIGQRIRKLRKEKDWTQKELGNRMGMDHRNVTKYETGAAKPSVKVLKRFAEAFEITVDELLYDASQVKPEYLIQDNELLRQFREVEKLDEDDKTVVKRIIQAILMKKQLQELLNQQKKAS
jgi:transcriptional regulator with XRE-family HTH domain